MKQYMYRLHPVLVLSLLYKRRGVVKVSLYYSRHDDALAIVQPVPCFSVKSLQKEDIRFYTGLPKF